MQCAVIEFARDACGLAGANSSEFDPHTPHPVIDLMDEQRDVVDKGGTMRLGAYPAKLLPGSIVQQAYGEEVVYERHRHRYEVNNRYRRRARGGRAGVLGHLARRPPGRVRRAAATCTRSSSARRRTPSSRAGPTARTRCSRRSCAAARERAEGRAPRLPHRARRRAGRPDRVTRCADEPAFRVVGSTTRRDAGFLDARRGCASTAPDGEAFDAYVVRHPGAVVVVPVDDDRGTCCSCASTASRSARELLEVPAGKRDVDGEPPEATARRELEEEIGVPRRAARAARASSTTRPASATSTPTSSSPPTSRTLRRAPR